MSRWARALALASGFMLYNLLVVLVGALDDITVVRRYFQPGRQSTGGQLLIEAMSYGALVFVVAFMWTYATIRPLRNGKRETTLWTLIGVVAAWFGWMLFSVGCGGLTSLVDALPGSGRSGQCYSLPLWGHLATVASGFAVVAAGALARRFNPSTRQAIDPLSASRRPQRRL